MAAHPQTSVVVGVPCTVVGPSIQISGHTEATGSGEAFTAETVRRTPRTMVVKLRILVLVCAAGYSCLSPQKHDL